VLLIGIGFKNQSRQENFITLSFDLSGRGNGHRQKVDAMDGADMKNNQEILLMSFNIRHGVDHNGNESLNSIIDEIKSSNAQIIALQEVDRYMPRSRFKNQAREIATALGFHYVYGETINVLGIKYGNAIVSAYPIIEHQNLRLPSNSLEGRAILKTKIDVDGDIYHVLNTHLGLSRDEREKQMAEINRILEELEGNIILMGDFNEHPYGTNTNKVSDRLLDTALVTQKDYLNTYAFYSDVPNTRIDRIYVSANIGVIDHFVIPSRTSDHSMVFTLISHKKTKKEGII
jgi:endonuclease/exonuclease/phosphatase family metal-dependent hydrolase